MNNQKLIELLESSALLEENVAKVYLLMSRLFSEDAGFWYTLHNEEIRHAAIFRRFSSGELPLNLIALDAIDSELERIRNNNRMIEEELVNFLSRHKKRLEAYRFALMLEELSGESIFQKAMSIDCDSEHLNLLQRINCDDRDHHKRISELIESTDMEIRSRIRDRSKQPPL